MESGCNELRNGLQHQRDLFHNFIDFKKAFDRVWHEGLWQVLRNFSTISIGGRSTNNLRFADDIDLMGGSEAELQELTNRLVNTAGAYGMEVSSEKSKVLVNSVRGTTAQISMNGQQLEEVTTFKYVGATLTKDGRSTTEIKTRLAMATAAMAKLQRLWKSKEISFLTKIKLYKVNIIKP